MSDDPVSSGVAQGCGIGIGLVIALVLIPFIVGMCLLAVASGAG